MDERQATAIDSGYAPERWEFDGEVTRVFDDMLDRSIPQYETMREAVALVASSSLRLRANVLDLGCSRGGAMADLLKKTARSEGVRFLGLEISEPMLAAARERFRAEEEVDIMQWDLRDGIPATGPLVPADFDVVLAVLTLMFVPVNYRKRILAQVRRRLAPGGTLVVVEKILGETHDLDDLFSANYHAKKRSSGYTPDEIVRKRLALEGVLVPLTAAWNVSLLEQAGFSEIDCFWRWMNFAGWVARA